MPTNPLLIFDFDGVIIDGMNEYWWSARKACLKLVGEPQSSVLLAEPLPESFRQLRPWVHKGWEMVLLAAELLRTDSPLILEGVKSFSDNYTVRCNEALKEWQWSPGQLQKALEDVRKEAITNNQAHWLNSHKAFPGLVKRLNQLGSEGIDFAVLTTKGTAFTAALLNHLQLKPNLLFGHESGSKSEVLLQLSEDHLIRGFIEDRRETLETVLKTPGLDSLSCYLASWGYLKPEDKQSLPNKIHLLEPKTFATPLASWP